MRFTREVERGDINRIKGYIILVSSQFKHQYWNVYIFHQLQRVNHFSGVIWSRKESADNQFYQFSLMCKSWQKMYPKRYDYLLYVSTHPSEAMLKYLPQHPASHQAQIQTETESNPSIGDWWARLYLTSTSQCQTLAQALFPPERWRFMSQCC